MTKKNRLLAIVVVFVFAVAFLMPSLNAPVVAATGDPSVSTVTASVDDDVVTLKAKVTNLGTDEEITSYGFYWGDDKSDVEDGEDGPITPEEVGDDTDELEEGDTFDFDIDVDDLDEDTDYYVMAYIVVDDTEYTGTVKSFTLGGDVPEVTTDSATDIKGTSATLNGTIESYGSDDEITEYGFYYGTSSSPSTKKKVGDDSDNIDEGDDFDYDLSGLKADTKYYFKAYAKNSEGIAYGTIKSFTTKKEAVVASNSIFTIGLNYYLVNGKYQVMDAAPYIKNNRTYMPIRYVAYAMGLTDSQIQWNEATQTVILTKGNTTVILVIGSPTMFVNGQPRTMDVAPELTSNRTCLPIAWVASAFGYTATWNGTTQQVTITGVSSPSTVEDDSNDEVSEEVSVSTKTAKDITEDSATVYGAVTEDGGLNIEEFGFYYGTEKDEVADGEDGNADYEEADGDVDDFNLDLEDLDSDTRYYYMAYAIDEDDDIHYGSVKYFTTDEE